MWRLLAFLIILVASVWLGIEVAKHPGFLLIVYQPWMVQMPLWFALLAFVLFIFLFYILINSIDRIHFLWFKLKNWLRFRREHQSFSKTQLGLSALIEARWKKAEKLLLNGVNQTVEPLINYLGAAKAAHEQGSYERRDCYIQKAYQIAPNAQLAIGITQAELEIEQGQFEHALATLSHLQQLSPRHPRIVQLQEKVYVHLGDWDALLKLLPLMRKTKIITKEQYEQFEKNIYSEKLRALQLHSLDEIKMFWQRIPKAIRLQPEVVSHYAIALSHYPSAQKELEELIRKTIKQHYEPNLLKLYGTLTFVNLNRQLVIVGAWVKLYGQRQELLWLLGRLCMRLKIWGKAKDYFEKCLALGPDVDATLDYGKLLEQLGDSEQAKQIYREGLEQAKRLKIA